MSEQRAGAAAAIDAGYAVGPRIGAEGEHACRREHSLEPGPVEIEQIRRQRPVRGLAVAWRTAPRFVMIGDHLEPRLKYLVGLVVERNRGQREIIEQCLEMIVEQRQPVLHARMAPSFGDRLVKRVGAGRVAEAFAPGAAEVRDRRAVEWHL